MNITKIHKQIQKQVHKQHINNKYFDEMYRSATTQTGITIVHCYA